MTDQQLCPTCQTPLTDVVYTEHCGPHAITEFKEHVGYVVDVGDLYGDWNMPDYFVVPSEKLGERRTIYRHVNGGV